MVQFGIIWHKKIICENALHQWMPAISYGNRSISCKIWAHIVISVCRFGKAREHIQDGNVLRRLLDAAQIFFDDFTDFCEKTVLDLDDFFLCT